MKTKHLLFTAAITALLAMPIQSVLAEHKDGGSKDARFIKKVADANMTEMKLAKLAADNGQKQEVKDFAARMTNDHGKAETTLKPIAEKLKVGIPEQVSAEHQQTIDKLMKLKGEEFDKAYAEGMVKDHKKVIAMFEKMEGNLQDPDLKKFAQDTLPTLKEHLEMAQKLEPAK